MVSEYKRLKPSPSPRCAATVTYGHGTQQLDTTVTSVGPRGLRIATDGALGEQRNLWVSLELPTGKTIRPLVDVLGTRDGQLSTRYRHLFPKDRAALDAFFEQRRAGGAYL